MFFIGLSVFGQGCDFFVVIVWFVVNLFLSNIILDEVEYI